MEKLMILLEKNKRTVITLIVAYVLYLFSQVETYDVGGLVFHIILNTMIFIFVSKAVVTYAEKYIADKRKNA